MYESLRKTETATTHLEINAGVRNRVQSGWKDSKCGWMHGRYLRVHLYCRCKCDAVWIQFFLLKMGMLMFETCRGL